MSRMRQRIAQRLKDAQNTSAMLTTFNEIDMRSDTRHDDDDGVVPVGTYSILFYNRQNNLQNHEA